MPRGTEFQVNTYTDYSQSNPSVACDAAGEFVVVWDGGEQDGDGYGIFGQRIDSTGAKAGSEFRVNTYTTGTQQLPAVAAAEDGDFVVVWESYDDQDGDGYGVFGQRFSGDGTPSGSEFQVNTYSMFSQQKPAVGAGPNGAFTVAWSSPHGGDGVRSLRAPLRRRRGTRGDQRVSRQYLHDRRSGRAVRRGPRAERRPRRWQLPHRLAERGRQRHRTGRLGRRRLRAALRARAVPATATATAGSLSTSSSAGSTCCSKAFRSRSAFDADGSGSVAVNELISAINSALGGCA